MAEKMEVESASGRESESVKVPRVLHLPPNPEEQAFHHYITLGIEDTLRVHPLIKDIKMAIRPPVVPGSVISWERKYKRKLPMDLKNYYYSTNGFRLTWNLDYGGELVRVGEMNINSLSQLAPLEGSGKPAATTLSTSSKVGGLSKLADTSSGATFVPDYNKKGSSEDGALTGLKISFAELQKFKNGSSRLTSTEAPHVGNKHPLSPSPKSLHLPPQGQAFQLDSSKFTKGLVCLVYLEAASQVTQRTSHGTPKKKPGQFRQVDFKDSSSQSHGHVHGHGSSHSHYYNDFSENPLNRHSWIQGHDTASFNKSIDELEEEREVANTESSFSTGVKMENVQIWFLDPSFEWHFLAPTFSHYYKMLLYHLGLPEWEYRFTSYGLSSFAEQMFWVVAPHLLQPVQHHGPPDANTNDDCDIIWSTNYPPEVGKPNPVNNVINMNLFRKKKRDKK